MPYIHYHTYIHTHQHTTSKPHPIPSPLLPDLTGAHTHTITGWSTTKYTHSTQHTPHKSGAIPIKKNTLTCIMHSNVDKWVVGRLCPTPESLLQFKAQASGSCTMEIQCHLLNQKGLPHIRPRSEWGRERGRNTQIINKQWIRLWHHLLQWLESSPHRDDYITVGWSDIPTCQQACLESGPN